LKSSRFEGVISKKQERNNKKLTVDFVKDPVVGRHTDLNGLTLVCKEKGRGSWSWRGRKDGTVHEIGFGSSSKVSLKEARLKAARAYQALEDGQDPRVALGKKPKGQKSKSKLSWILSDVIERKFESLKPTLKGEGRAGRWLSPLEGHVITKIGTMDVRDIDAVVIEELLRPIWHTNASIAQKCLQRLVMCMIYAADQGALIDENAAARAKRLLGPQVHVVKGHTAMDYKDLPAFYTRLCAIKQSSAVLALRLLILTAHRCTPVRMARVPEFNIDNAYWTAPAANMKGPVGKVEDFRCPLSPEALSVFELARAHRRGDDLFPAKWGEGHVSDAGMSKWLRQIAGKGPTVHGFRSTFRTWAAEQGQKPLLDALGFPVLGDNGFPMLDDSEPQVLYDIGEVCLQH
tara:strand:+ start:2063 stop:3271 length:1209 start_codon:yes stop_codon:yes gene_type:complete